MHIESEAELAGLKPELISGTSTDNSLESNLVHGATKEEIAEREPRDQEEVERIRETVGLPPKEK